MIVDGSHKGLPPALAPIAIEAIGTLGWTLRDDLLPTPVAVLREAAMSHNRAWMRDLCARTGIVLAPHGKTTMSPELFALQVEDGAWGLTVANVHQARVACASGARRVVVANQVASRSEREWLAMNPQVMCLVDSVGGVRALPGTPALLEVGFVGGRCGCRTLAEALVVARSAYELGNPLVGVEAFEGLIPGASGEDREANVRRFLDHLVAVAEAVRPYLVAPTGELEPVLTAGGSIFPDLVSRNFVSVSGFRRVLRSGCYLTGDHGIYAAALERMAARDPTIGPLQPALEVWASVLSRPEPGRVILGAGKRDIGIDAGFPVPLRVVDRPLRARVVQVDDQHVHLVVPEDEALEVGERVALGITHPCTTFDRWSVILRVDEDWRVIGAVHTRFG